MTSAPASRGRLFGYGATWVVALVVVRDIRRARRIARLDPPVLRIDVRVDPPSVAAAPGTGPGGADGHDDHPRADDPPAPIQMAALGDSSIAGVGASRLSTCLAVQIAERVAMGCGRAVHVRGHGVSGARTADVTRQARGLDAAAPPDVVVVVVGANDVVHVTPPWRYVRAVTSACRELRERFDAPVIVCSLPEFRVVTAVGRPLRTLAVGYGRLLGVLQRLALWRMPGVRWVDARRLAGPTFRRRPDAMATDGFHPSDLGYTLLADALAPPVVSALDNARRPTAGTPHVIERTF